MGGPSNVTSTTNTSPPAYAVPHLSGAMARADNRYNSTHGDAGRKLVPGAQDQLLQTIQGGYLNSNPYLDQTFDRAAQRTQTQLSSEFAGQGRDLSAALPARSSQLQDLSAQIYGGNYQAERDRQVSAIDQAQGYDPLNMYINQIAGLIPGAGGSTQSTQPVFRQGLFSDRRLKRNIERIGTIKGYPWYAFEYIWGEKSEGVMSDEIPREFVYQDMGYDVVDYASLLRAN
jgi:hypothetical protein